jgi:dTDP-glucose 4,6-dehydratase
LYKVLTQGIPGNSYHIGGGNQLTNIEIAEMICDILDERRPNSSHRPHRQWIQLVKDRPGHDRRYALDTGKIERELEWHPRFTIKDGLHRTVDWYLAHPEWVDGIRRRKEYRSWIEAQYIP